MLFVWLYWLLLLQSMLILRLYVAICVVIVVFVVVCVIIVVVAAVAVIGVVVSTVLLLCYFLGFICCCVFGGKKPLKAQEVWMLYNLYKIVFPHLSILLIFPYDSYSVIRTFIF